MSDRRGDLAACRALLRGGSRSFDTAARLLPARVHEPASALYAFCRVADDLIDEGGGAAALPILRARVAALYDPAPLPPGPAYAPDRALGCVAREHGLPRPLRCPRPSIPPRQYPTSKFPNAQPQLASRR